DVYLLYVLGPSYAYAAIFVGLDPDDVSGAPLPDSVRAQVLIGQLARLHESEPVQQSLAKIAEQLTQPWSQARKAFDGEDIALGQRDHQVVEEYFAELRGNFSEAAYDAERLAEAERLSEQLVEGEQALKNAKPNLKDLLTAIWLARLEHPDQAH